MVCGWRVGETLSVTWMSHDSRKFTSCAISWDCSSSSSSSELEGMVVLYREVETRIVSEFCCVGVAELDAQGLAEESFVF